MKAILSIVALLGLAGVSSAEEIPLKSIYGLNIAGTSNVKDLVPPPKKNPDSEEDFVKSSLVEQVRALLGHRHVPAEGKKAREGFVVAGVGKSALEQVQAVLAGKAKPLKEITAGEEASLVVFAYASGRSFCLDDVKVNDGEITVAYHLEAHEQMSSSAHFALIPLPKLPEGKVTVEMKRSEDTGPEVLVDRLKKIPAERIVSNSFSFQVVKDAE